MSYRHALVALALLASPLALNAAISEEKDSLKNFGYVWIKDFFSEEDTLFLKGFAEKVQSTSRALLERKAKGELIVVAEADHPTTACRVEDMLSCYPEFNSFIEERVTPFVSDLCEEPYVTFKDKLNFKWPGGGAFPPHQDYPAFALFGPKSHLTTMIGIDRATEENGCLYIAQDWRSSLEKEEDPSFIIPYIEGGPLHGSIQQEYVDQISWLPLEIGPRDLIIFDSFVPHYSKPNHSHNPRRALFITYNQQEEGAHRESYYQLKRSDPHNPMFHFSTPTKARGKD